MNWRLVYKNEDDIHHTINNQLVEGYKLLEDVVQRCADIKVTLEKRVKGDFEYQESSYGANSQHTSYYPLSDLYEDNIEGLLNEYYNDMNIVFNNEVCRSPINGKYLGNGDNEIDINSGSDVVSGINKYFNMFVDVYNYDENYNTHQSEEGLDKIYSRINSYISDVNSNFIKKFATHLKIFIDSKNQTSQHTDFHDDLLYVYGTNIEKFSIESFNELLIVNCYDETDNYLSYMNSKLNGVTDEDKHFKFINSDNLRAYMCTNQKNQDKWTEYVSTVRSEMSEYLEYRNKVTNLCSEIDLQISAHNNEYKVNGEIIDTLEAINLEGNVCLTTLLDPLNDVYLLNDTFLTKEQRDVLKIADDKYNESNVNLEDDVFHEILEEYINNDLSDIEMFNLCVEYPYLNLYIEQYYLDNISSIEDDDYWNNLTTLYSLNMNAKCLLDKGVVEVENIEQHGTGKITFDGISRTTSIGLVESNTNECEIIYVDFVQGVEGAYIVSKDELMYIKDNLNNEIIELDAKYENPGIFTSGAVYEELKSMGIEKAEDITLEVIETLVGIIPGGSVLMSITVTEFQEYFETQKEIESLEEDIEKVDYILDTGDELSNLGVFPAHFTSLTIDGEQVEKRYIATPKTYQLVEIVEKIDKINDPNTSPKEKDELQMEILKIAEENGNYGYGLTKNGNIDYASDGSGDVVELYYTYKNANEGNKIDEFISGNYKNDDGFLDLNSIIEDNKDYNKMFDIIDDDITNYSK